MGKKVKKPQPIKQGEKIRKKETQSIISEFHVLMKKRDQLNRDESLDGEIKQKELDEIQEKMDSILQNAANKLKGMGGLERYQRASLIGVEKKHFDSSKWCLKTLRSLDLYQKTEKGKMKLLDAGSLTDSYRKHTHIYDVTAIDLNPRLPTVKQQDFFELQEDSEPYDIIVLSLILNFVSDPCKRAEMLMKTHRMLAPLKGVLLLVLPRPCMDHSRYMTHHHFTTRLMPTIGYEMITHHRSAKLIFYAFRVGPTPEHIPYIKRSLLNDAEDRNNFSIIVRLDPSSSSTSSNSLSSRFSSSSSSSSSSNSISSTSSPVSPSKKESGKLLDKKRKLAETTNKRSKKQKKIVK